MVLKTFKRYYFTTVLILVGASLLPLWHFSLMLKQYYFGGWTEFNITLVIPFMAVSVSILLGFLLLPLLKSISVRKSHLIMLLYSVTAFCGLSIFAETISTRLDVLRILIPTRRWRPPDEIAEMVSNAGIPLTIRIHYYIFSIVLIVSILSLLYNFAQTRYADGQPGKRFLSLQGVTTSCYALAYFFVRVVQYENFATRQITPGSTINAAVCFVLAALVMGLWGISFLRFTKYTKTIPPLIAVLTVFLLYGAQYLMLDRQFYLYAESELVSFLLRIVIAIVPGALVYLSLRFVL